MVSDYSALRKFASGNKGTLLPFSVQCGYALLPIYVGQSFSESLLADIRSTYRKRWCVLHVPSLLESDTGYVHTLEAKSFWGCVFGLISAIMLWKRYGPSYITLPLLGGLTYTVGAIIEVANWPVLIRGVVGPHELFHIAVLAGIGFFWSFVHAIGAGDMSYSDSTS